MNSIFLVLLNSLGRSALKIAGASLVAHGVVTGDMWTDVSGALITLIGVGASVIAAHTSNLAIQAALNTPVPVLPADTPLATPANPTTGGLL